MKDYGQHPDIVETVKEAEVVIINGNNENDNALIRSLKNEISHLKAANSSLKIKLRSLREKHLPHILLVEDNYDTVQIITEILKDNYNIIDVGNGVEALSILKKIGKAGSGIKHIDAILLDIHLPGMCGLTLCNEIKKKMRMNIPVIICSARNTKKDVIKAISFGAEDYIIKPFQDKTLFAKLDKWTKLTYPCFRKNSSPPSADNWSPLEREENI